MRCPICKQGHGADRYSQESLDKHMASFHHMDVIAESATSQEAEADVARSSFVEAGNTGKQPMSLASKICWSWLGTVLLVGLTLIILVLSTKI